MSWECYPASRLRHICKINNGHYELLPIHKTVILETSLKPGNCEPTATLWVSSFRCVFSTTQCSWTILVYAVKKGGFSEIEVTVFILYFWTLNFASEKLSGQDLTRMQISGARFTV